MTSIAVAQGYGPGMMGGYGPDYGRGFGGALAALNLSEEQQDKLFAPQEQNRRKNFDTMSKMRAEAFKLRRLMNSDSVDLQGDRRAAEEGRRPAA